MSFMGRGWWRDCKSRRTPFSPLGKGLPRPPGPFPFTNFNLLFPFPKAKQKQKQVSRKGTWTWGLGGHCGFWFWSSHCWHLQNRGEGTQSS